MERDIKLSRYIPPFMLEYKELEKTLESQSKELQSMESQHWKNIANRYILSCDTSGIERYEKLLDLKALDDDTLNDRINRVLIKWNGRLPYNYAYLVSQLESICGSGNYSIDLSKIQEYEIAIKIALVSKNSYNDVVSMINKTVPCNLKVTVSILYNRWGDFKTKTWKEMSAYTWEDMRSNTIFQQEA